MTRRAASHTPKPPPCASLCWEWLGRTGTGHLAWRYVSAADGCGHYYDADAGIWRWNADRPGRTRNEAPAANTPPPSGGGLPHLAPAVVAGQVDELDEPPF